MRQPELPRRRIFLLSPADCSGERAQLVFNRNAGFDLAIRLRQSAGVPIGEVFSFLSGLYFRGKLAYARTFARPADTVEGICVITAGDGLQSIDTPVTLVHLERYASIPVSLREHRYRLPLERDLRDLRSRLTGESEVVLLGSIASGKYLEILSDILGDRLRLPRQFVGMGDMRRGSLLLRCVAEARELDYVRIEDLAPDALPRTLRSKR